MDADLKCVKNEWDDCIRKSTETTAAFDREREQFRASLVDIEHSVVITKDECTTSQAATVKQLKAEWQRVLAREQEDNQSLQTQVETAKWTAETEVGRMEQSLKLTQIRAQEAEVENARDNTTAED